jgi:hypothetical protein
MAIRPSRSGGRNDGSAQLLDHDVALVIQVGDQHRAHRQGVVGGQCLIIMLVFAHRAAPFFLVLV